MLSFLGPSESEIPDVLWNNVLRYQSIHASSNDDEIRATVQELLAAGLIQRSIPSASVFSILSSTQSAVLTAFARPREYPFFKSLRDHQTSPEYWLKESAALFLKTYSNLQFNSCETLHPHISAFIGFAGQYKFSCEDLAMLHILMGEYLATQGDVITASQYFRSASRMHSKVLISENESTVNGLLQLGNIWCAEGRYEEALELFQNGLEICIRRFPTTQHIFGFSLNIGGVYQKKGKHEKAASHFQKCLEMQMENGLEKETVTMKTRVNLAYSQIELGHIDEAIENLQISLQARQTMGDVEPLERAEILHNLGLANERREDFSAAIKYYNDALGLYTQTLGANHFECLDTTVNLANACRKMGNLNLNKALEYYGKALEIIRWRFGDEILIGDPRADETANLGKRYYSLILFCR